MKRTSKDRRATKEQVLSAQKLTAPEVRFIVSNYYDAQEMRKRGDMQLRHLGDKTDPSNLLSYWTDAQANLEKDLEKFLGQYVKMDPVGQWLVAQHGIKNIIAAGLLAHLNIEGMEVVSGFWRFAGLDPTHRKWEKGQKRPYNPHLKQICWHAGQCFMKTYNSPDSFYGKLYKSQKDKVVARNEAGYNKERAKIFFTKSAEVKALLKKGKLPASNLDAQARNYAVKIFLSHLHVVMYWNRYHRAPPLPFAQDILKHGHIIKIPHIDMFPGLEKAYYGQQRHAA
jgi:hypothetical protein